MSELTSTSPRLSTLQVMPPPPVLSPHAPVEENEVSHATIADREIAKDSNGGDGGDSDEDGD